MHANFDGLKKVNNVAGAVIPSLDLRLGVQHPYLVVDKLIRVGS